MIHTKTKLLFTFISILVLVPVSLNSQGTGSKPTRQSSLEAYSKGNYEQAYDEFSELLTAYPRDPLYLYYTGVCLVRLQKEPVKAASLLKQAKQGTAQMRSVPPDISFWLGRACQLSGNYTEAISAFEEFKNQAGKKTARELLVPEYLAECLQQKGALPVAENTPAQAVQKKEELKLPEAIPATPVQITKEKQGSVNQGKKADQTTMIPDSIDKVLTDAIEYQAKADSVTKTLDEKEKELDKLAYARKVEARAQISEERKIADSLQTLALNKFDLAQNAVNSTSLLTGRSTEASAKEDIPEKEPVKKEPLKQEPVKQEPVKPAPAQILPDKQAPVFSLFQVLDPPPANDDNKIGIDPEIPKGLIYRIQVAVFRNPVATSYFKGISPVYGFRVPAKDVTIYYAGMFRKVADAGKALTAVRQKGFKDAFITPFMDGKTVSTERAGVLEKEWGDKPLFELIAQVTAPRDTVPPTLSFRVEIMKSAKPVKDDVADAMKKIAGIRGLDTEIAPDGSSVYLIGRFITYESAEEYANLLVRNGYKDARVGAWLGRKEIPVETARQLFEKIE